MTATIVATPEPGNSPPRVKLEVSGLPGTDTGARVVRESIPSGNITVVRTGNPAPLVSGGWVGYDYEAEFGGSYYYHATGIPSGTSVFAFAVSLDPQAPWLIHPGIPALSQPIIMERRGDRARAVNQGVHAVLGRSTPVVVSDGVRRSSTFTMTLRTETLAAESAMWDLLADNCTLLLQVSYPNIARVGYDWVSIGEASTTDLFDFYGNPYVRWTLPCTVTTPPVGLLQSQWTWAGLVANYATWQDVVDHFTTWADVITDSPH